MYLIEHVEVSQFYRTISRRLQFSLLFFHRIAFLLVSFWAVIGHAGFVASTVEALTYHLLKLALIQNGESENYAECVVQVLKWQGTFEELTDISNLLQPGQLVKKLEDKANIAQFVCRFGNPFIFLAVVLIITFLIITLSCVCVYRCFFSSKPRIVKISSMRMYPSQNISKV